MNKVILIGSLGKDPEVRATSNDTVCNFSIAKTERWTDKNGTKQEKTEWHNLVAWNRMAEIAGEFLHKGSKVAVEGKLQTSSWDDKDGSKRYKTEVVAAFIEMLGDRQANRSSQHRPPMPKGLPKSPSQDLSELYTSGSQDSIPF